MSRVQPDMMPATQLPIGHIPAGNIHDPVKALRFLLAGNAHCTFRSEKTGVHLTFHVQRGKKRPGETRPAPHFVSVLTSPDNYEFLGTIFAEKMYAHGRRSRITPAATSAKAFAWLWRHLSAGHMPPHCEVWHEGRCGRCGRQLTHPESIETGMGPECLRKMEG